MGDIKSFRDLLVWKAGKGLACAVYRWVGTFPREHRFELGSQLRRAAYSVPLNIAEGYGKGTTKQFLRMLRDARGSLAELDTAVEIGSEILAVQVPGPVADGIGNTARLLQGLIGSLERKLKEDECKDDE